MLRDSSGDWIGTFVGHKGAVWSCKLDRLGLLCATASGDYSAKLWDAITGASLFTFPHKHIVKSVDFSKDSTRLATAGHEGLLRIYDLKAPEEEPFIIPQLSEKKININKCLWLNASTVIAAGSDGIIRFWDINQDGANESGDSAKLSHFLSVDAEVRDMELKEVATGQIILTVASGKKVSFFDMEKMKLIKAHPVPIHFREEGGASLHPSGKKFVTGGSDLWVRVFDYESGRELECHKGHHGPVRCVRYSPDGMMYASGSEDGTIRLWKSVV